MQSAGIAKYVRRKDKKKTTKICIFVGIIMGFGKLYTKMNMWLKTTFAKGFIYKYEAHLSRFNS